MATYDKEPGALACFLDQLIRGLGVTVLIAVITVAALLLIGHLCESNFGWWMIGPIGLALLVNYEIVAGLWRWRVKCAGERRVSEMRREVHAREDTLAQAQSQFDLDQDAFQRRCTDLHELAQQLTTPPVGLKDLTEHWDSDRQGVARHLAELVLTEQLPEERATMSWAEYRQRRNELSGLRERHELTQSVERLKGHVRSHREFYAAMAVYFRMTIQKLWTSKRESNNPLIAELRREMVELVYRWWDEDAYVRSFIVDLGATADVDEALAAEQETGE